MRSPRTLTCATCGKATSQRMGSLCVECYLISNLPSTVEDEPWVWADNFEPPSLSRKRTKRDDETIALRRAVVDGRAEESKDGKSLWLLLEQGRYRVPLTVEAIDKLALRTGILVGKWLVYRPREEIDNAWLGIARATFNKKLGKSAKVSTREEN